MTLKQTTLILFSLFFANCFGQIEKGKKFNLDFETYDKPQHFPKNWIERGDYSLSADSLLVHSGKFSGKIQSKEDGSFGAIAYEIPANYVGKTIKLEGYMKLKNVTNGYGGLLISIEGNQTTLAYKSMESQNINGTKDWQKYSITLPYPKYAETIQIAGLLVGKGEAWFDDFVLTIDGKDVQTLEEQTKLIDKASLDKEFDLSSKIDITTLNEALTSNLELLGKVWGFLKYHHPKIADGNYNWDFELFRMLPKYIETKNKTERDQYLIQWISKYGDIDKCIECKETASDAILKPDMSWFNDYELNSDLKDILSNIYKNRFQGSQYYIGNNVVGNPNFLHENKYYSMSYDDDGFNLLALYRFWNMINYFSPNKHLTEKDWETVLKEYIPKFIHSKNKLDYELACIQLIGELNDTHSTTIVGFNNVQKIRGEFYPPFNTQFVENKLVVTEYYNPELQEVSKIKVGDIITHIEHEPVKTIVDNMSAYYPASNEASKLRNISGDILRSNNKEISIDFMSNDQKHQHSLSLYEKENLNMRWYNWTDEKCYKMLDGNIGYITLKTITADDVPIIKDLFKNTKGIIIDIRNYPSTFVPFTLGNYFVSSSTPFVKFTGFNIDNPGEFNSRMGEEIPKPKETYKGKLIVLVNQTTQSQAEYTSMAFRAGDNTTVVGSKTAGADGNISTIYLPGGLLTNISGIGVLYPDGTETQRVGIVPDVEVKPTIEGIKNGIDEILEKAIEMINE